ncbi:sugar-binding transcriptional regulator [Rubellimicrobium sp. CFH 75288]|uniref:sugar-binding transcriptional regulator n=1 Tax=Rubellimicrobium sp. CFH 75288 TaxID=2697034 RepID=UPI0014121FCE|nr:sugar-binding transcriptional regulator [Rubellimicrobium sp. CFH 75288]NAZ36367.1 sugar-binding transcriptional regulator [Rubellimicrobium sp. CFH 75288]
MGRAAAPRDDESLAIRAAWLHYAGGLTQTEVAARLGVSAVKAHRLVAWANQNGAVKVSVEGSVTDCLRLEQRLVERFGLATAEVIPDLGEEGLPLRALGHGGAAFLGRIIGGAEPRVIGVGNGRTLAAAIAAMPRQDAGATRFVSLVGVLTRRYAANPHDVMHRLAEKTGAEAYVMPVPFFANTAEDRAVLLSQPGVREVVDLAASADLLFVGIGTAQPDAQLVTARMIAPEEIREVQERGGVGEMLGHFFDAAGHPVETSLAARTLSPDLGSLAGRRVVALAGGAVKTSAIRAVLHTGLLSGLITDERTARALVAA